MKSSRPICVRQLREMETANEVNNTIQAGWNRGRQMTTILRVRVKGKSMFNDGCEAGGDVWIVDNSDDK